MALVVRDFAQSSEAVMQAKNMCTGIQQRVPRDGRGTSGTDSATGRMMPVDGEQVRGSVLRSIESRTGPLI